MTREQRALFAEWNRLINLPSEELRWFLGTPAGKSAGLSRTVARQQGIRYGRESARAILRMREKDVEDWTDNDWDWASRQVAFVKRMSGLPGPLLRRDGSASRKYLALLVWGHQPKLHNS